MLGQSGGVNAWVRWWETLLHGCGYDDGFRLALNDVIISLLYKLSHNSVSYTFTVPMAFTVKFMFK